MISCIRFVVIKATVSSMISPSSTCQMILFDSLVWWTPVDCCRWWELTLLERVSVNKLSWEIIVLTLAGWKCRWFEWKEPCWQPTFSQIRVELTRKPKASSDTRHYDWNEVVQIAIDGCQQLECPEADVVEGLIINAEGLVWVFGEPINSGRCVVGLDDGSPEADVIEGLIINVVESQ